jgi:hypothetical protein
MNAMIEICTAAQRLRVVDLIEGIDELRDSLDSLNADLGAGHYVEVVYTEDGVKKTTLINAIRVRIVDRGGVPS